MALNQSSHLLGTCVVLFLFVLFFLVTKLPNLHPQRHKSLFPVASRSSHKAQNHRIAIILLYTSSGETNPADVVPHLTTFCAGAAGGKTLVDFLVFHTGVLDSWPLLADECPENVRLINLKSTKGLAERLVRVVTSPTMDREEMIGLVESYIQANPYALVEFKPAFGYIFADYLGSLYTHWGYSDFDILFGDLDRWITEDELTDYDIVTYTFGDQNRLYLRGQFTFHKKDVPEVWRVCNYLTAMDERFDKIIHKKERYRVESAEGCYSAAVMDRNDLKVKFAVKAWTDIHTDDTVYSHGVYYSRRRNVIYKADKDNIQQSGTAVSSLPARWFEKNDSVYRNLKKPLQAEVGEREFIELVEDPSANCMFWAMKKYQRKLCLKSEASASDTVFWIDGKLYKQKYKNTALDAPVLTAPFFHFQEWKRTYRFDELSTLTLSSPVDRFVLTPEGAIPLSSEESSPRVPSPLGLKSMKTWTGERWQLPRNTYCIISLTSNGHTSCDRAVSWHDVDIVSPALDWLNVRVDWDVTLVLTVQITTSQFQKPASLSSMLEFVNTNISLWRGKPCVVLVALPDEDPRVTSIVHKTLGVMNQSALIALVISKDTISRKALLNMAIDAVPTRWYMSGIELERGLALSTETVALAHRAAFARHRLRGQILIVPQFGLIGSGRGGASAKTLGLADLKRARIQKQLVSLQKLDAELCPGNQSHTESVMDHWWEGTDNLNDHTGSKATISSRTLVALDKIELEVLATVNDPSAMANMDDSPILLTDNLAPQKGVLTHQVAREVENLVGLRCFNTLRFTQLATLGYMFDVLAGAFAASWDDSRKVTEPADRCQSCTDAHQSLQTVGMKAVARAAKTAILWMENEHGN